MMWRRKWTHVAALCARRTFTSRSKQLHLTKEEQDLFNFIKYVGRVHAPKTQIRVAGGWVRDKLLGRDSPDIDFVLDNMTGTEFANKIIKFQAKRNLPRASIGIVRANADKSKHLEVATVSLDNRSVDFVHLRSEVYSENSRIPDSTPFATPLEDVQRRDLTINALFYNLLTDQVEDFTGQGLVDLERGIIRTPLDPLQTFLDDPLRILRALRFACEFRFDLAPEIQSTVLNHPELHDAMMHKVSRERIGIETMKMLSGSDPPRAFALLSQFHLLDLVLLDSQATSPLTSRQWTDAIVHEAQDRLAFLHKSRLAHANFSIGFVEALGAALSPLFIDFQSIPELPPVAELDTDWIDQCRTYFADRDDDIIRAGVDFLRRQADIDQCLRTDEIVELLKVNVKFSKAGAKRIAHIVEAVASFPSKDLSPYDMYIHLILWTSKYSGVLSPALSIVAASCDPNVREERLTTYLKMIETHTLKQEQVFGASKDFHARSRKLDGRDVKAYLGGENAGPRIAQCLTILAVHELILPQASLEDEKDFLHRLAVALT